MLFIRKANEGNSMNINYTICNHADVYAISTPLIKRSTNTQDALRNFETVENEQKLYEIKFNGFERYMKVSIILSLSFGTFEQFEKGHRGERQSDSAACPSGSFHTTRRSN